MDIREEIALMEKPVEELTITEIEHLMTSVQKSLTILHNNNGPEELKEGYQTYLGKLVVQYKKRLHIQ